MLATETENFLNMKGKLELPFQIKQELVMLRDIIKELNGQQIITSRTGVTFSQLWNENKADERLPFMVKKLIFIGEKNVILKFLIINFQD